MKGIVIIDYYTLQRTTDSGVCPLKTCVTIIHHSFNNAPISVALLVCTFLYIRKDLLLGQAEASPTLVMSIKVFSVDIYIQCMYTSTVRHSVYTCLLFQRSANLNSSCTCFIRYATDRDRELRRHKNREG